MLLIIGTFFIVLFMLILGFIGEIIASIFSSEVSTSKEISCKNNEVAHSHS